MKNYIRLIVITLALFSSCGKKNQSESDNQVALGYWGQISGIDHYAPTPLFLIFVKPEDTYNICVASHLIEEFPQLLTQVDASAKIWGRYINRTIKTNLITLPMDKPGPTEHPDTTYRKYTNSCPDGDVVVGYANIPNPGQAASKHQYYMNGDTKVVTNPSKVVFLQNPDYGKKKWIGLYKKNHIKQNANQLINRLMKRDLYQFLSNQNEMSLMAVLLHEFGHVWGLCDMYPLGGGHTNCDADWSNTDHSGKIILTPHATMAAATWKNPLFLQNDDITGIRELAKRNVFKSNWSKQNSFPKAKPAKTDIHYFKFNNIKDNGNSLHLNISLYNQKSLKMQVTLNTQSSGDLRFNPINLTGPIDIASYTLQLGYPTGIAVTAVQIEIINSSNSILSHESINL